MGDIENKRLVDFWFCNKMQTEGALLSSHKGKRHENFKMKFGRIHKHKFKVRLIFTD